MRWVVALCVAAGCASSDDGEVSRSRCTQVRDHLVELRLQDATNVDRDAHREAMKQALGDGFVASCQEHMSSAQLTCALRAKVLSVATACAETSAK
jgi:hypothetical protein